MPSLKRGNTGTNLAVVTSTIDFFDILPKRVRAALAGSNHDWSPEEVYDWMNFPFELEEPEVIQRIRASDSSLAEQHYAILAAGKRYPI